MIHLFFSDLGCYLIEKINKWLDLELYLMRYAAHDMRLHSSSSLSGDSVAFQMLCNGLVEYLSIEQSKQIAVDSVAVKVLKAVVENEYFSSIYSYNYTDLNTFAKQLRILKPFQYKSVHGSLNNHSIILGVTDVANLRNGYYLLIQNV